MGDTTNDKVIQFKPQQKNDEEIIKYDSYYMFDLPEDFIYTDENINKVFTLYGIYKILGLNNESSSEATFVFADLFGEELGLVPINGDNNEN
jgi:hypothetical protein